MKSKISPIELFALLPILVLAGYLRFANVAGNPGWYSDEGTFIIIAQNMLNGRFEYMVINQSTLLFAKLPLFPMVLAGLYWLWGVKIEVLRYLTGSLGLISVGLLYWVVRRTQERGGGGIALLSALMLAIYPQAVLYSRLGFSYNMLTPLVLLITLGLWEYLHYARAIWLILAALCMGIGGVSDLLMFTFIVPLSLVVSARRWRDLFWSLPLIALPFGLYSLTMLLTVPDAFLFDLQFTLLRLSEVPLPAQLSVAALNHTALLSWDSWLAPAIVGLFMLRPVRWLRLCLLLFFLPLLALERTTGLIGLGFYYIIPLFPFVAIGMAALVYYGTPQVLHIANSGFESLLTRWGGQPQTAKGRWLRQRAIVLGSALLLFLLIFAPFLLSTFLTIHQVQNGFRTTLQGVLVEADDARKVAQFVNSQVAPTDVVIASPATAWLFNAHIADFQQALAIDGISTRHLPGDIPPNRYIFDPRYIHARFVIIDNIWRNWAALNMPEVEAIMQTVQEDWPLVFESGNVSVYQNPEK